jgi:hypothetical protein
MQKKRTGSVERMQMNIRIPVPASKTKWSTFRSGPQRPAAGLLRRYRVNAFFSTRRPLW